MQDVSPGPYDCQGIVYSWHLSDPPILAANVGYEGYSGSSSNIAKPTRLTQLRRMAAKFALTHNRRRPSVIASARWNSLCKRGSL
jgi:hypothetical protein